MKCPAKTCQERIDAEPGVLAPGMVLLCPACAEALEVCVRVDGHEVQQARWLRLYDLGQADLAARARLLELQDRRRGVELDDGAHGVTSLVWPHESSAPEGLAAEEAARAEWRREWGATRPAPLAWLRGKVALAFARGEGA